MRFDFSPANNRNVKEDIMFNAQSDYALNKRDQEAIVCQSATDEPVRLTREDFASDEEFLQWKEWSDQDYRISEKAGRGYYDYCIQIIEELDIVIPSVEDSFIAHILETEHIEARAALLNQVRDTLTETQYRRLRLYCVENLTVRQIAEAENVRHQSVVECLAVSKKKIQDFLKKGG